MKISSACKTILLRGNEYICIRLLAIVLSVCCVAILSGDKAGYFECVPDSKQ